MINDVKPSRPMAIILASTPSQGQSFGLIEARRPRTALQGRVQNCETEASAAVQAFTSHFMTTLYSFVVIFQ